MTAEMILQLAIRLNDPTGALSKLHSMMMNIDKSGTSGMKNISTGAAGATSSMATLGKTSKFVHDVLQAFLLYKGFVFLKGQVTEFIRSLIDLEHRVALVQTQLNYLGKDFRGMITTQIMDIAKKTGVSMDELARAEYNVVSANIEVSQSFKVLELSARAAVAGGLGQIDTAFQAALTQVNAFNLGVDNFNRVFDLQFNLVKRGIFTYEQMANVIGEVSIAFASMGQNVEVANAALAAVSQVFTGPQLAEGATGLKNAVLQIQENVERFEDFGISVTDSKGDFRDFISILKDLKDRLDGLSESARAQALQDLFQEKRAVRGIKVLLNEIDKVEQFYVEQKFAAGDLDTAFKTVNETLKQQAMIFKQELIPAVEPFVKAIADLLKFLNGLNDILPGLTRGLLQFAVVYGMIGGASMLAGSGRFALSRPGGGGGFGGQAGFIGPPAYLAAGATTAQRFGGKMRSGLMGGFTRSPTMLGMGAAGLAGYAAYQAGAQPDEGFNWGGMVGAGLTGAAVGGMMGGPWGAGAGAIVGAGLFALGEALETRAEEIVKPFSDALRDNLKIEGKSIGQAISDSITGVKDGEKSPLLKFAEDWNQGGNAVFQGRSAGFGQKFGQTFTLGGWKSKGRMGEEEKDEIMRLIEQGGKAEAFLEGKKYTGGSVTYGQYGEIESRKAIEDLSSVISHFGSEGKDFEIRVTRDLPKEMEIAIERAFAGVKEYEHRETETRMALRKEGAGMGMSGERLNEYVEEQFKALRFDVASAAIDDFSKATDSSSEMMRLIASNTYDAVKDLDPEEQKEVVERVMKELSKLSEGVDADTVLKNINQIWLNAGLVLEDEIQNTFGIISAEIQAMASGDFALAAQVFAKLGIEGQKLAATFAKVNSLIQSFTVLEQLRNTKIEQTTTTYEYLGKSAWAAKMGLTGNVAGYKYDLSAMMTDNQFYAALDTWAKNRGGYVQSYQSTAVSGIGQPKYGVGMTKTEQVSIMKALGLDENKIGNEIKDTLKSELQNLVNEGKAVDLNDALIKYFTQVAPDEAVEQLFGKKEVARPAQTALYQSMMDAADAIDEGLVKSPNYTSAQIRSFGKTLEDYNKKVSKIQILEEMKRLASQSGLSTQAIDAVINHLTTTLTVAGTNFATLISDPNAIANLLKEMEFITETGKQLNFSNTNLAESLEEAARMVKSGLIGSFGFTADKLNKFAKDLDAFNRSVFKVEFMEEIMRLAEVAKIDTTALAAKIKATIERLSIGGTTLSEIVSNPDRLADLLAEIQFGDINVQNSTNNNFVIRINATPGTSTANAAQLADQIMNELNSRTRAAMA